MVDALLALTVPLSVAPVVVILEAEFVVAAGAEADVACVIVFELPLVPFALYARTR